MNYLFTFSHVYFEPSGNIRSLLRNFIAENSVEKEEEDSFIDLETMIQQCGFYIVR